MPDVAVETLFVIISVAVLVLIGMGYTGLAWQLRSRLGAVALLPLWAISALVAGYLFYWRACSLPLTCDIGHVDYRALLMPRYTLIAAAGFAAPTIVAARLGRKRSDSTLRWRTAFIGGAGMVGCILAAQLAFATVRR